MNGSKSRFEVFPVPAGEGWLMVADLSVPDGEIAGMFPAARREFAQDMADRLNVRELAGRS